MNDRDLNRKLDALLEQLATQATNAGRTAEDYKNAGDDHGFCWYSSRWSAFIGAAVLVRSTFDYEPTTECDPLHDFHAREHTCGLADGMDGTEWLDATNVGIVAGILAGHATAGGACPDLFDASVAADRAERTTRTGRYATLAERGGK